MRHVFPHIMLFRVVCQLIPFICLTCLYVLFTVSFEDSQYEVVPLTAEKVLEFIEQAYPNPITPEDLARYELTFDLIKFVKMLA